MWEFEPMGDGAFSSLRWNWWNSVWYGPPLQFQAFFALGWWFQCMICMCFVHYLDNNPWWYEMTRKNMCQMNANGLKPPTCCSVWVQFLSWGWCLVFPSHVSKARLHSTAKVWSVTLSYTLRYSGWWFQTFLFSIYIGNNNPNWRTNIFQTALGLYNNHVIFFSRGSNYHQPVLPSINT